MSKSKEIISTIKTLLDDLRNQYDDDVQDEAKEVLEEDASEYLNEVKTGLGAIYWKADNLLLQSEFETFIENLKTKYP